MDLLGIHTSLFLHYTEEKTMMKNTEEFSIRISLKHDKEDVCKNITFPKRFTSFYVRLRISLWDT
jgi:hypothetical protein